MNYAKKLNYLLGLKEITPRDKKRLLPHMTGWNRLMELLVANVVSEKDMKKMLFLEATGEHRIPIINMLVGRIASKHRQTLREIAAQCSKESLKQKS